MKYNLDSSLVHGFTKKLQQIYTSKIIGSGKTETLLVILIQFLQVQDFLFDGF